MLSETKSRLKSGKKLTWVFIVIAIIAVGVLGYGFYGGIKTKAVAKNAEELLKASQEKWKPDQILDPNQADVDIDNIPELKAYYTNIKNDCDSALTQINSIGQTKKTGQLKADLEQYYTLGKQAAEDALVIVGYLESIEKVAKDIESISSLVSTAPAALAEELKQVNSTIEENIKILQEAGTTPSIEKSNQEFISILEDFSKVLEQATSYLENNQISKIAELSTQFGSTISDIEKITTPVTEEVRNDILSDDEGNQLEELANKIQAEATNLQKTIFTF